MSKVDVRRASQSKASLPDTAEQPVSAKTNEDEDFSVKPDFIYGGPFIKVEKPSPFLNIATPVNILLQGTFKKSFAYYSLKERLPVILTKVIDYLSREGTKIKATNAATDEDIVGYIQYITKLKNDLVTNKRYDLLTVDTPEARRWNQWISASEDQGYFTNTWVFSECYVYRRLREGCELSKGLQNFDPFDEQKEQAFQNSVELMCVVAEKLLAMLPESEKDKRKADFIALLKVCLWSNKCDLSLSLGEQVSMKQSPSAVLDPFQMVLDLKDKLLVDDTGKIADQVIAKAENMARVIEGPPEEGTPEPTSEAPTGAPAVDGESPELAEGEAPPEPPKIPCPAKMTTPQTVMFDIVCDNSGYELFTDLCLAHFLIAQGIVKIVRFHVKKIPWFVSDVTPRDFKYVINACANATFSREVPAPPKPEPAEGEEAEPDPPRTISSEALRQLGEQWARFSEDGTFVLMCDDFWTSPHVYKDMKKIDPALYRKLQFAVAVMFKGDLNYRKLLGEKNWVSTVGFEPALQGFLPAPVIAVRTVKADLICGLPKGKAEQLAKLDPQWMEKGDYGVIQFCAKAEPLKVSERPCEYYGQECRGAGCPPTPYL